MGGYSIRLAGGSDIFLAELYQYRTYAGLLEGLPDRVWNQRDIAFALERATQKIGLGITPYLVPPKVTPIEPPPDWRGDKVWERLPATVCLASFESSHPGPTPDADCSSARIVWFQDDFAFPIDPEVVEAIRAIDWVAHAKSGWW